MAAGFAAQRLGAESPLHFGVAPQSTAQCPSPPSRPVSFRVESLRGRAVSCALAVRLVPCAARCIRLARGTPASGSRTAGRLQVLFESPSPKPARFQVDQPPALPMGCAEPRGGAHARRPGRFGRGHRGCFGGGSGVARTSAQERRTRMLRSVRDPLVAATAEVQRADCALKSGR